MKIFITALCSVLALPLVAQEIRSTKSHSSGEAIWYGSVELRHHINTFYEQEGYLGRQEPSMHARLQLGLQLYNRSLDIYATLGAFKRPKTQQALQRRPEIAADLYLVRNTYFRLLQYNIFQLPFDQRSQDENTSIEVDGSQAGSVYIFGLDPQLRAPLLASASKLSVKLGVDAWTKLYSRKQYTTNYSEPESDDIGKGSALTASDTKDVEPIEDTQPHYDVLAYTGLNYDSEYFPNLSTELSVNYNSKFVPQYEVSKDGVETSYKAERYSFYKMRLRYKINERLALLNDFYHFHGGFFQSERDGEERRFRNIARLSCQL